MSTSLREALKLVGFQESGENILSRQKEMQFKHKEKTQLRKNKDGKTIIITNKQNKESDILTKPVKTKISEVTENIRRVYRPKIKKK